MNMLTLYQPSRAEGGNPEKKVVPPGVPYLTKVNGKLVMARAKREKPVKAIDLLGEAFGQESVKVVKKKSRSISAPPQSHQLLIGGVPNVAPTSQPPYSTPTPQGPFPQGPVMMPPYGYQHSQLTYGAPFNAPAPTPKQFEDLKSIDAHYNRYVVHQHPGILSAESKESTVTTATKTAVTVIKHTCANCGRLRSRRYHKDHPIAPHETPTPEFCRKCQRDTSETESESETNKKMMRKDSKLKSRQKEKEKFKKKHRKHLSSSSDQESSEAERSRKSYKKGHSRLAPSQDITTVVEEVSDEEVVRSRRGRSSQKPRQDEAYDAIIGSYVRLKPSSSVGHTKGKETKITRERSRTPDRPVSASYRIIEAPRAHSRQRSPSPIRQHIQAPVREPDTWGERSGHNRDWHLQEESEYNIPIKRVRRVAVPMQFVDDEQKEPEDKAHSTTNSHEPIHERHWQRAPNQQPSFHGSEKPLPPPTGHTSASHEQNVPGYRSRANFESVEASSSRANEARQRRRRERRSQPGPQAPWGPPHVLYPQNDEPIIVVTEKYVYRPKREVEEIRQRQEEAEDQRRQQEYADRAVLGSQYDLRDDASHDGVKKYYKDDWAKNYPQASKTGVPMSRSGYIRKDYEDSSLAESEDSYRTDPTIPPRVPSPPSPFRTHQMNDSVENWDWQAIDPDHPPYPPSSDCERTVHPVSSYDITNADDDYYNRKKDGRPSPGEYLPPRGRSIPRTDTMRKRPEEVVYGNREHRGRSGSRTDTVSSRDTFRSWPDGFLYETREHQRYSPNTYQRQSDEAVHENQEQQGRGVSRDEVKSGREEDSSRRQKQRRHLPNEPHKNAEGVEGQTRRQSRGLPADVRGASDGRTGMALVRSPSRPELYDITSRDQSTEPGGDKHVTFRESVSEREAFNTWTPTEMSDIAACMNGWGGSQVSAAGGGSGWMRNVGQPDSGFSAQDWGAQSDDMMPGKWQDHTGFEPQGWY